MTDKKKAKRPLSSFQRRTAIAMGGTLLLMAVTWMADKLTISVGDEKLKLMEMEIVARVTGHENREIPNDYLAVNVGYDRELVDINDAMGFPAGKTDITDRCRLNRFLSTLSATGTYRLIVIDVDFNNDLTSPCDSSLFRTIASLPRTIISSTVATSQSPLLKDAASATSGYVTTFLESGFAKIPFIDSDGNATLPLAVYNRAFLTDNQPNALRQPVIYLKLPVRAQSPYGKRGNKIYYNLGADLLDVYDNDELAQLAKDKVVLIGDFTCGDMHDTYAGQMAGPVIIINAIEALRQGDDRIKTTSALLLAIGYFMICLAAITPKHAWVGKLDRRSPLGLALSLLNYNVAIFALMLADYILFGEIHDIFFPSLTITLLIFINRHISSSAK